MVIDGDVNIKVNVDMSQVDSEMSRVAHQSRQVVKEWGWTRTVIMQQIQNTRMAIGGLVTTFTAVLGAFNVAVTPIQTALITMIQTSLQSLLTIHRMMEAGSMGMGAGITIALSIAAIGTSALAFQAVNQGMEDVSAQYQKANTAIAGLETMIMAGMR